MQSSLRALAALALIATAATPAIAQTANLTGSWTGGYLSADGSDVNTFDIRLTQQNTTLSGDATEVNVFGDSSKALFLTSTIQGVIQPNGAVTFLKTYDGSGGVSHSVTYRGQLDATGRRIRGSYDAGGATGNFEMVR